MYIPKYFEITDKEEIVSFIHENGFGQLISLVKGKLFSSHLPFLLNEEKNKLIGHMSRQNQQWTEIDNQDVLVTFQGAHDYISPSWYVMPNSPPTWNYQAVHIYGHCTTIHDKKELKNVIDSLTEKYESRLEEPWRPSYDENMLHGIVGLELNITNIECKYKLSQNKSLEDRKLVCKKLEELGSQKLAEAMKNNGL